MGDTAAKSEADEVTQVSGLVDKVNVNLHEFTKQQQIDRDQSEVMRKNMALVKKVLQSDEIAKVLSMQSTNDVDAIDVTKVQYVEKPKKPKKADPPPSDATSTATGTPIYQKSTKVVGTKGATITPKIELQKHSKPKPPAAVVLKTKIKEEALPPKLKVKKEEEGGTPRGPDAKRQKRSVSIDSDEDDFEEDERDDVVDVGDPQPDSNVVMAPSGKSGRRVYGILGSTKEVVKGGCFLLYDVVNIYQFDEANIKAAKVVALRECEVKEMSELASTTSMIVDGGVAFINALLNMEAEGCTRPTYLERPIVSMRQMELKPMFNEMPEPIRSAMHRYCKDVGLFKGLKEKDHKQLVLLLDEVAQRVDSELAEMRLHLPAVTVSYDKFEHASFV